MKSVRNSRVKSQKRFDEWIEEAIDEKMAREAREEREETQLE